MEKEINNLVYEISSNLKKSSLEFFRLGIEKFHKIRKEELPYFQTAVANLCISIELLLKYIIAEKSHRDLYKNIPQEFQIYLSNYEIIPDKISFNRLAVDLRGAVYKTLEFNECVSFFYIFYPNLKQKYRPFLSLISNIRNSSIHSFLPKFQSYDLLKVAYLCIDLFKTILGEENLLLKKEQIDANNVFIKEYDNVRVDKVRKIIEEAREKSKKLHHPGLISIGNSWTEKIVKCPICESDAFIHGYTEVIYDYEGGYLNFFAETFECESCELKLDDFEELRLVGIDLVYDMDQSIYDYWEDFPPIG